MPLARRQHGRHDDGAGVHRAALERVVEILAMRRRAVDQRRAGRAERARMTDRGARAVIVARRERRLDVVLVARGDAEAEHVDGQVLAPLAQRGRQARGIERKDAVDQLFGDRDVGNAGRHEGSIFGA